MNNLPFYVLSRLIIFIVIGLVIVQMLVTSGVIDF